MVEPISYFRLKVRRSRKGGVSLFFRNSEPILLVYIQDGARLDVLRGQLIKLVKFFFFKIKIDGTTLFSKDHTLWFLGPQKFQKLIASFDALQ